MINTCSLLGKTVGLGQMYSHAKTREENFIMIVPKFYQHLDDK